MTDVSNLDELANAISNKSPAIKKYAQAQAAATQSQELEIRSLAAVPEPPPEPIAFVSSIKAGDTLQGVEQWSITTTGQVAAVEFWANDAKLGEDTTPPSPFVYALDTTKLPEGSNNLGLAVRGMDGSRLAAQVGMVVVDNVVTTPVPPPTGELIWNADLSTGNLAQYGDWEWGGTFDGVPKLSERVQVGTTIDGIRPAQGSHIMKLAVAPGDQFGGSTGWRCTSRQPAQSSNDGKIVMRAAGYDSAHVYLLLLPPGYPFGANEWQTGAEYHHDNKPENPNVAPFHCRVSGTDMGVDVAGQVGTSRVEYVNQRFNQNYARNAWYILAYRYKHGLLPDGAFELWSGLVGTDREMKMIVSKSGIASIYPNSVNYELFGHYRGQSGTETSYLYFNGKREYRSLADALSWANGILASKPNGWLAKP